MRKVGKRGVNEEQERERERAEKKGERGRGGRGEGATGESRGVCSSKGWLLDVQLHEFLPPQVSFALPAWHPGCFLRCWCKDGHPKKGKIMSSLCYHSLSL